MTPSDPQDLSHFSMMDLFRMETETQTALLEEGLLALERAPEEVHRFKVLMRAAHSLKGAARLVNINAAVQVAHAMEDCFVAAQEANVPLAPERVDILLEGVDLLNQLALHGEETPSSELQSAIQRFIETISAPLSALEKSSETPSTDEMKAVESISAPVVTPLEQGEIRSEDKPATLSNSIEAASLSDSVVRVSAENINRLMRLAGESVVAARWLETINKELAGTMRMQAPLSTALQHLNTLQEELNSSEAFTVQLAEIQSRNAAAQQSLAEHITALQLFDRRLSLLTDELYNTVLDCRMRPFADGVRGFPRMVREVARSLGKEVNLEILGESTLLDRDILERLEAPLGHLLRNAIGSWHRVGK